MNCHFSYYKKEEEKKQKQRKKTKEGAYVGDEVGGRSRRPTKESSEGTIQ